MFPSIDIYRLAMRYAACLAHQGLFKTTKLTLIDDLVPAEHLTSLASCVTQTITIQLSVSGCQLVNIFKGVKAEEVIIRRQSLGLGRGEMQALVQAMESRVERVELEIINTLPHRLKSI